MIAFPASPAEAGLTPSEPPASLSDDGGLVARLRAGAPDAPQELMARYRPRLQALAFRLTRNHHDAEDIVQETWVRAFRAVGRFRSEAALGTWLHVIAQNIARNRYRCWRRRRGDVTVSLDSPAAAMEVYAWRDEACLDQRGEIDHRDLEGRISAGMEQLSERDRRILHLRVCEHATYRQMAGNLGIKLGSVKSQLARARERLRTLLEAESKSDGNLQRRVGADVRAEKPWSGPFQ